ncbi:MAG: type II toxin-antitoxin system PemK/MazF family toxin [Deltaproteobacteria bacterium]|nr:type II toxin-antitoxin system PemK/MazF family toxin [Deltaproteobacteria bacterium]
MVTFTRGDVIQCDLNPVMGTEQAGIRPCVIVQIDRANIASPHTIIVPFTTKIRRALLSSHAFIPAGIGGLLQDSVALCEQVRVIDKRRVIKVFGHLEDSYILKIGEALSVILGLEGLDTASNHRPKE